MGVVVKHSGWISKGIAQVKAHAKYIGFRSDEVMTKEIKERLGIEEGKFFDSKNDKAEYKDFIKSIENNKALKYKKSVKAHKFVFSLKEKDLENYLSQSDGKSYKDLIRSTLDEFGREKSQNLEWIAVEHLVEGNSKDGFKKSSHPHVHVIIKGISKNRNGNKVVNERVKFNKEDYQLMRDIFDKEFNKVCEYERNQFVEYDKTSSIEQSVFDKGNKIIKAIQKAVEVDFVEKQQERRRIKNEQSIENGKEREKKR